MAAEEVDVGLLSWASFDGVWEGLEDRTESWGGEEEKVEGSLVAANARKAMASS